MNRLLSILLRFLFVTLVVFFFFQGRPPATAQSNYDAVQNERINALSEKVETHERTDDARVLQIAKDVQLISNTVSEQSGEMRGIFGALAVLQILAMFFQFRKEKK